MERDRTGLEEMGEERSVEKRGGACKNEPVVFVGPQNPYILNGTRNLLHEN